MRQELEFIDSQIDLIDTDNLYQAIADLKLQMRTIVELLDKALPVDKSEDV